MQHYSAAICSMFRLVLYFMIWLHDSFRATALFYGKLFIQLVIAGYLITASVQSMQLWTVRYAMSTQSRTLKQCSQSFLTFWSSAKFGYINVSDIWQYFFKIFLRSETVSRSYFFSKNVVLHLLRKHLKISVKEFTLNACNWFILTFKASSRKCRTVLVAFVWRVFVRWKYSYLSLQFFYP